jgi:hypothetical protein
MFEWLSVTRQLAAVLALGSLMAPLCASAQELPSYAQPVTASNDEVIHGRIASVDGAFNISVFDDRGFIDNVELHDGTIINPTGLALSPGMSVTIAGFNAGAVFDANEIDTPYSYSGPLPAPVFYGDGYWCPGFAYGYGPAFSLAIVFGFGGYHYEHRRFHGRPWNGRGYAGVYGAHSYASRGFSGARRLSTAVAARSFAGARYAGVRYTGVRYSAGGARYRIGGGFSASGYFRGASAPSGFARSGPVGGVARSAAPSAGFARGGGGFSRGGGAARRR